MSGRRAGRLTTRGRAAVALLGATCLVAATWCAVAAASHAPSREPRATAQLGAPLWSPRRVPDLVREQASRALLAADLQAVLAGTEHCAVVTDGTETLARLAGDRALAPASGLKLLTGAAALDVLGPDTRFVTVAGAAEPPVEGVVAGDLFVVGGGDPTIGTEAYAAYLAGRPRYAGYPVTRIEALADAIAGAGIQRIDGDVVGDDDRHEAVRYLPSWKPSYRTEGQSGPLGALVVNGGFSAVGGRVGVADPAAHFAQVLAGLLEARGVAVGGARSGDAPPGLVELARLESATVAEIVAAEVSASDNLASELLAREIGIAVAGSGTTDAGTAAIEQRLAGLGVPTAGVDLVDGSGLAPANRATCDSLVAALELGAQPRFAALDEGLSVAGVRGTLAERFAGHPLAGTLRAKTGHIDGVVALAGLVETARAPVFAFLASGGFSEAGGAAVQQRVAETVAAFPRAATARDLVPAP